MCDQHFVKPQGITAAQPCSLDQAPQRAHCHPSQAYLTPESKRKLQLPKRVSAASMPPKLITAQDPAGVTNINPVAP